MSANDNQLLLRIIKIMDCFDNVKYKWGVLEISNQTGLPYSTVGRLLQNLKMVGLLNQDEKTKEYFLGVKVLSWAGSYLNNMDLLEITQPFLINLQKITQETISLYIQDADERICVFRKESPHSIRMVARIGERMPLHLGAAGKIFLLQYSEVERAQYHKDKKLSVSEIDKLDEALKKIVSDGFATSFGERVAESASVAAPIFNLQKKILAVVNISGPIQRFESNTVAEYVKLILETSRQISREFGYGGEN